MKCLRCSKTIDPEEAKKIEEVGVEPFCSEYCCLVYSGNKKWKKIFTKRKGDFMKEDLKVDVEQIIKDTVSEASLDIINSSQKKSENRGNREKIKYLKRYMFLNKEIDRKLQKVMRLRAKVEKITSTLSDMPPIPGKEKRYEEVICEMIDCEREIDKLIDQLVDLKEEIRCYITITGDKDEDLLAIINEKNHKI